MTCTVRTTPEADDQIRAIDDWWRRHRTAAPEMFLDELAGAFELLSRAPLIGHPYGQSPVPGTRRVLLTGSRYHVYYMLLDHDVRVLAVLDRDVAIKVLPEAFAHDADRLARFTREAKTLASLNHPNIAAIYGLEVSGGITALVMELVEGEDLSQHIARGAIPIDDTLPIAKQIAEALEAAHEQGIVHRDLKPAIIEVRADGTVKVLDFGLAKALDTSAASATADNSPTITTPAMTQAGMILGTAAYMSPEQARGKVVDKRADTWAFGAVLFEMLAAKPACSTAQRSFVAISIWPCCPSRPICNSSKRHSWTWTPRRLPCRPHLGPSAGRAGPPLSLPARRRLRPPHRRHDPHAWMPRRRSSAYDVRPRRSRN